MSVRCCAPVPVRAPPACGNSSGQRQLVTVDVEPAAGWRLDPPCRSSSAGGVDAGLLCTLHSPRRQGRAKLTHPAHRPSRPLSRFPKFTDSLREDRVLRAISSRLADPPAAACRWAASPLGSLVLR